MHLADVANWGEIMREMLLLTFKHNPENRTKCTCKAHHIATKLGNEVIEGAKNEVVGPIIILRLNLSDRRCRNFRMFVVNISKQRISEWMILPESHTDLT